MNSHTEQDVGARIAAALSVRAAELDDVTLARLRVARETALSAIPPPSAVGVAATPSGITLDVAPWYKKPLFWVPALLIAALASVGTYQLGSQEDFADNAGAADARMLGSETPIDALLDKDFAEWVQESQQQ